MRNILVFILYNSYDIFIAYSINNVLSLLLFFTYLQIPVSEVRTVFACLVLDGNHDGNIMATI